MRKVHLMDSTVDEMTLTVWSPDYHGLMDQWKPFKTILHLVDVGANFSDFERTTALALTSKTIIIENPTNSTRCMELLAHIQSLSEDQIELLKQAQPTVAIDLASITEVFTIQRIMDQLERDDNGGTKEIAALVYGVITKFGINSATIKCCIHCKRFFARNRDQCENAACNAMPVPDGGPNYTERIYMAVSFADHSATLDGRMMDENAVQLLGHSGAELKSLPEEEIDAIFERFILQRFAIKVIVKRKSANDYFVNVLSIEPVHSDDLAAAMKP